MQVLRLRNETLKEIIASERSYVNSLLVVTQVFILSYSPLSSSSSFVLILFLLCSFIWFHSISLRATRRRRFYLVKTCMISSRTWNSSWTFTTNSCVNSKRDSHSMHRYIVCFHAIGSPHPSHKVAGSYTLW